LVSSNGVALMPTSAARMSAARMTAHVTSRGFDVAWQA
jgi:hypothetical protein